MAPTCPPPRPEAKGRSERSSAGGREAGGWQAGAVRARLGGAPCERLSLGRVEREVVGVHDRLHVAGQGPGALLQPLERRGRVLRDRDTLARAVPKQQLLPVEEQRSSFVVRGAA